MVEKPKAWNFNRLMRHIGVFRLDGNSVTRKQDAARPGQQGRAREERGEQTGRNGRRAADGDTQKYKQKKGCASRTPNPNRETSAFGTTCQENAFLLLMFASSTWREVCRSVLGADLILIKTLSTEGGMI
jgi:hypothetical protein